MKISPLPIAGAYHIVPEKLGDNRGAFARLFCNERFAEQGLNTEWAQMNLGADSSSCSRRASSCAGGSASDQRV